MVSCECSHKFEFFSKTYSCTVYTVFSISEEPFAITNSSEVIVFFSLISNCV